MTIGQRVRRAREAAGYSTSQVAGHLNISQQSIRNKETDRNWFKPDELAALAAYFKIPVSRFFNDGKRGGCR